jgi:hypothetical protein
MLASAFVRGRIHTLEQNLQPASSCTFYISAEHFLARNLYLFLPQQCLGLVRASGRSLDLFRPEKRLALSPERQEQLASSQTFAWLALSPERQEQLASSQTFAWLA